MFNKDIYPILEGYTGTLWRADIPTTISIEKHEFESSVPNRMYDIIQQRTIEALYDAARRMKE